MKEEHIRNLVKKSMVNTSEDFTDKLMVQIEAQKAVEPILRMEAIQPFRSAVLVMIIGGLVFFSLLFSRYIPSFTLLDVDLKIHKIPFLVILLFSVLISINHIFKLHYSSSHAGNQSENS